MNISNIKIRPASGHTDIEFISTYFEETIALWEDYTVTTESLASRRSMVADWLSNPEMRISIAAAENGEIVGFNTLFVTRDYSGNRYGKIIILYVLPSHRKAGIARLLKQDGENWLRSQNIQRVITEIDAKNQRMLEINRQAGFKIKSYTLERRLD